MADPIIATWILEFLLRCPSVGDAVAGELLLALPLPDPHPPRLSSALLLRRLSADLSRRSVSSRTLHSLEVLHRLCPSPSLLPAFAAVAVECTLAPLRHRPLSSSSSSSSPPDADAEFFDAVNKIWNCLVADLERSEAAGLVSSLELRKARKEMEAAVVDPVLREKLVRRETKEAALEAVRVCVDEVGKEMGPTFLEAAAETIVGWNCGEMVGSKIDKSFLELRNKMRTLHSSRFDPVERGVEMDHASRSRLLSELVESSNRIKLNGGNLEEDQSGVLLQDDGPKKETFNGKISNNEPQSVQLDPIQSDPKEVVQNCKSIFAVEYLSPDAKPLRRNSSDANTTTSLDSTPSKRLTSTDRSSDRSASAHTYEFVSVPNNFQQSPESRKEMDCLSSKNSKVSSAKTEEFVLRKRKRKWNLLEEETLKKAVSELGAGNWKLIKGCYPEILKSRSEVTAQIHATLLTNLREKEKEERGGGAVGSAAAVELRHYLGDFIWKCKSRWSCAEVLMDCWHQS